METFFHRQCQAMMNSPVLENLINYTSFVRVMFGSLAQRLLLSKPWDLGEVPMGSLNKFNLTLEIPSGWQLMARHEFIISALLNSNK